MSDEWNNKRIESKIAYGKDSSEESSGERPPLDQNK
jgi:hypothetical protein